MYVPNTFHKSKAHLHHSHNAYLTAIPSYRAYHTQNHICYHWPSVPTLPGNTRMMNYGILINIAYWSHPIFMCMYAVAHTYIYEALLLGRRGRCCSPRNYNKPNSIWSIMLVKNITKTMMLCRRRNFIYLEKLSFITPTWDDDVKFMIRYIKLCNLNTCTSICLLLMAYPRL